MNWTHTKKTLPVCSLFFTHSPYIQLFDAIQENMLKICIYWRNEPKKFLFNCISTPQSVGRFNEKEIWRAQFPFTIDIHRTHNFYAPHEHIHTHAYSHDPNRLAQDNPLSTCAHVNVLDLFVVWLRVAIGTAMYRNLLFNLFLEMCFKKPRNHLNWKQKRRGLLIMKNFRLEYFAQQFLCNSNDGEI